MPKTSLYLKTEERFDSVSKGIKDKEFITQTNKRQINSFTTRWLARGITKLRILTYLNKLITICKIVPNKDFKSFKIQDVEKVMNYLNEKDFSANYKAEFVKTFKVFWRFLYGLSGKEPAPKVVNWLSQSKPPSSLRKEDLISKPEIKRMIDSTKDLMLKALLSTLYNGALRPGELRGMKIKDVVFKERLAKIYVRGKMKHKQGERFVFILDYELLKSWVNNHPKGDGEAWLWPINGGPITMEYLNIIVKRIGKNAEIKKRIWPYLFRHSTALWLYKELGVIQARKFLGHEPGSKMERHYCHLNEEDLEETLLEKAGYKESEKKDSKFSLRMESALKHEKGTEEFLTFLSNPEVLETLRELHKKLKTSK